MSNELIQEEPAVYCQATLVDIDTIKPNPDNPNLHPETQIRLLGEVLLRHGWREPVVVSKLSGYLVKGHGRYMAAKAKGWKKIPVEFQDYADAQCELSDLIADNRVAQGSFMDALGLGNLLRKLSAEERKSTGYTEDEILPLLAAEYSAPEANDSKPRILETLRVTKDEKTVITKAIQKYCLNAGKELEFGVVLAHICSAWGGFGEYVPKEVEYIKPVDQPTSPVSEGSRVSEVKAEIPVTVTSSTSTKTFKVKSVSKTMLGEMEVAVIRPMKGTEKYYTNNFEIETIARAANNQDSRDVRGEVDVRGEDNWLVSLQLVGE